MTNQRRREAAAPPVGIRRSTTYLPALESLRGLAIALVYAYHVDGYLTTDFVPNFVGQRVSIGYAFVRAGRTGVDLFFVLSSFLLSLGFLREAYGGARVRRRRYFARRALRIVPLYWLAVTIAVTLRASSIRDVAGALPRFVWWPAFLPEPSFLPSSPTLHPYGDTWWSVSTELQFYLLLPLLPLVIGPGRWRRTALGLALLGVAYGAFLAWRPQFIQRHELFLAYSVFGRASLFLWGVAAAWVYQRHGDRIHSWTRFRWWRNGGADALLAVSLGLLGMLLQWAAGRPDQWDHPPDHAWHVPEGGLWASVLLLLLLAPLATRPVLHNRVLARLGVLSYSIYLIHSPLVQLSLAAIGRRFGPVVWWSPVNMAIIAVLTLACIGLSEITYRYVELPFLRRKALLDG